MHPRALLYHPARMDHHCQPLFHELIEIHERSAQLSPQQLTRAIGSPVGASERELEGTRNIFASVKAEGHLAEIISGEHDRFSGADVNVRYLGTAFHQLMTAMRDYRQAGENIFNFQPAILDLFRHSDLGDAVIDRVRLPFPCFYMHFGPQAKIPVGTEGHFFDGAYFHNVDLDNDEATDLTERVSTVFLTLVTRKPDRDYVSRTTPGRFLGNDFILNLAPSFDAGMKISAALDEALKELPRYEEMSLPGYSAAWSPETIRQCLHLIGNALLFLSSDHSEVTYRYPHDAPANLIKKAETQEDSERMMQRANSKLWHLGFRRVHFVGDKIEREHAERAASGELQDAHWRRGHWRNQPHGEGLKQRKSIWILPTIVRADLGDPMPSRIYGVPR